MNHNKLSFIFCLALAASTILIGWQTPSLADSAGQPPIKDSITKVADSIQIAQQTQPTIVGVPVSQPVQSIFIAAITSLCMVLGGVQFWLKRMPTATSVKICGFIGKILDVATFFQPDKNTTGGVHDKPDPSSAVKKA